MKINILLEGTHSGDVMGGFLEPGYAFEFFYLQKGGHMSERTERLLRLVLNAWEKMTDNHRERFNDFLYRLVIKGEKFTDKQIIQIRGYYGSNKFKSTGKTADLSHLRR